MSNNITCVRNFINVGNQRIVDELDEAFVDCLNESNARIREEFNTGPLESFRCWMEENAEHYNIINHSTTCNDNNNTGQGLPINVVVRFNRKDSYNPTVLNYIIKETPTDDARKADRFARWK